MSAFTSRWRVSGRHSGRRRDNPRRPARAAAPSKDGVAVPGSSSRRLRWTTPPTGRGNGQQRRDDRDPGADEEVRPPACHRSDQLRDSTGRGGRLSRSQRGGQVDDDEDSHLLHRAERGRGAGGRLQRLRRPTGRALRGGLPAPARVALPRDGRGGVPGVCRRPAGHPEGPAARQDPRGDRHLRPQGRAAQAHRRALVRVSPARGPRPGAHSQPAHSHPRRAHGRPRPQRERRGHRVHQADWQDAHGDALHPRPRRGEGGVRAHAHRQPREDRGRRRPRRPRRPLGSGALRALRRRARGRRAQERGRGARRREARGVGRGGEGAAQRRPRAHRGGARQGRRRPPQGILQDGRAEGLDAGRAAPRRAAGSKAVFRELTVGGEAVRRNADSGKAASKE